MQAEKKKGENNINLHLTKSVDMFLLWTKVII